MSWGLGCVLGCLNIWPPGCAVLKEKVMKNWKVIIGVNIFSSAGAFNGGSEIAVCNVGPEFVWGGVALVAVCYRSGAKRLRPTHD